MLIDKSASDVYAAFHFLKHLLTHGRLEIAFIECGKGLDVEPGAAVKKSRKAIPGINPPVIMFDTATPLRFQDSRAGTVD